MENGITGKCEEVCLAVRIGSFGAKKIEKEGNSVAESRKRFQVYLFFSCKMYWKFSSSTFSQKRKGLAGGDV